jgi:deazaflavin-dependent oxidoreductase (nitroreductase family)
MASDYNATIIEEFRATGGHPGGDWAGTPIILIHHFAVVASSGGSPSNPAWYHNLKANPVITAEVGARALTVVAEELVDTARTELWPALVARFPTVGTYQATTARQIPVFILTRMGRERA